MKSSGILMPIFSLPSNYGIGTLGKASFDFIDFLSQSKQNFWQILPTGVTGYGNSPYQSLSAFAGNINLIDLDILVQCGLLNEKDILEIDWGQNSNKIDYSKIYKNRKNVLELAVSNFSVENKDYEKFCKENDFWLTDYSLFMAIKDSFGMQSFDNWNKEFINKDKDTIDNFIKQNIEKIDFYKVTQFWFFQQYDSMKKYANEKGIKIIGDIPFYVAYDSADVWGNPELFELKDYIPINVAGVPPDAFSDDGQLWGNPLYNYEEMEKDNFDWWNKRINFCFSQCDVLRIDHFRAFDSYYAIPFGNTNAKIGEWRKGVGIQFFEKLNLLNKNIIAEDLGEITDDVRNLIKAVGYPNMKVLQFAFGSNKKNEFLVHNHNENCVVYTGTHDNNTTKGWYKFSSLKEKINMMRFVPYSLLMKKSEALIKYAFSSVAKTIIVPMQDYLNLDEDARMNMPSTLNGNWEWRMSGAQLNSKLANKILKFKL